MRRPAEPTCRPKRMEAKPMFRHREGRYDAQAERPAKRSTETVREPRENPRARQEPAQIPMFRDPKGNPEPPKSLSWGPHVFSNQRDPQMFVLPSFCLRPRAPRPTNHRCSRRTWFLALPPSAARPPKPLFSSKCVVVWPRCSRPPKKHSAKNTSGSL